MPKKPLLLLSSAKSGVPLGAPTLPEPARAEPAFGYTERLLGRYELLRYLALVVGAAVVLLGAFDVALRVSFTLPSNTGMNAFAPAITALDPAARAAVSATTSVLRGQQAAFVPARLVITSIGIDARVERVGVKEDGSMATPSSFGGVGWYEYGARPGEAGSTVMAGHVNNGLGLSGVFAHLGDIPLGAEVSVLGSNGEAARYKVVSRTQYEAANAPVDAIFSVEGDPKLILITCEGDWDAASRSYDKRLVVVAELLR